MFLFETRRRTAASAVLFIWLCSGAACWSGRRTAERKSSMFILHWRRTTGPLSPALYKRNDQKPSFLLQSDGIKPDDFTWEAFQKFLNNLCLRPEIQSILEERCETLWPAHTVILHDLYITYVQSCRCLSSAAAARRGSRSSLWRCSWTSSTAGSETPDWTRFCTRRWRKSRSDRSWRDTRPTPASWREVTCLSSCLLLSPVSVSVWSLSEQWK